MKTIISILIIIILFAGCIDRSQTSVKTSVQNDHHEQYQQEILENSKEVVDLAKKDAKIRFNLSEENIKVDLVIPVEWTDTSLGYPEKGKEPGKDYQLETINGYTILLNANGILYEYHSDYHRIVPPEGPANIEDIHIEDIPIDDIPRK